MTAAPFAAPGMIPGRMWAGRLPVSAPASANRNGFASCATEPGDLLAEVRIFAPNGNLVHVLLNAEQLREIAADFLERAEVLDNTAGRNRRTPAWHIREGERFLTEARRDTSASDADVHALIAAAHFQAATALHNRTTHVVNLHPNDQPSGKDEHK